MTRMLAVLLLLVAGGALAVEDGPVQAPAEPAATPPIGSPQSRYNDGRAFAQGHDWPAAERAYRDATRLDPAFPEAWNGLGYALRRQGKYDESVRAYHEALRLRPRYPQALEYLGEAYVQMGRLSEAKAILARLRPLDPREADELAAAIARAERR